jgi:hypothetical protein
VVKDHLREFEIVRLEKGKKKRWYNVFSKDEEITEEEIKNIEKEIEDFSGGV